MRHILKKVHDHRRLDESHGPLFTLDDILHAELKGDNLTKLTSIWMPRSVGSLQPADGSFSASCARANN